MSLSGQALDRVRYLEPPQLRARVDPALAGYLEALASQRPVVLVRGREDDQRVRVGAEPLADGERVWVPAEGEQEPPPVVAGGATYRLSVTLGDIESAEDTPFILN